MTSTFKSLLICLLTALCIVGCNSSSPTNDIDDTDCKDIEFAEIKDSVCFNDIIDEYQYISLSNIDGYMLGEIYQTIISDGRIYISSDGVFCFDMKGNPIFKVNEKGGKNSEIMKASSISVEDGILYVHDEPKRVIHKYNSLDGTFIENISLPTAEKDIFKVKDCFIVETMDAPSDFYKGNARFLICDDFSGKPQKEYLTGDIYRMSIFGQVTFNNTDVLFADYFNNTIYKIDNNGCSRYYRINIKNTTPLPPGLIDNMVKNKTLITDEMKYQYGLVNVYENQDCLVGEFQAGTMCYFVHNKKVDKSIAFKLYSSSNYQMSPYKFAGSYKDFFIATIPTETIMMLKEAIGFGENLPYNHPDFEKQRILMNHTNDDNPIIALYKFKNF